VRHGWDRMAATQAAGGGRGEQQEAAADQPGRAMRHSPTSIAPARNPASQ
jgi:hypothetical protein